MASSRGWAAMTSPERSFPTPRSSTSTAHSSRRHLWTATSIVTATGLTQTGLDLRPAASKQHFLTLLAEHVAARPDGVVWGHGWDQSGVAGPRCAHHGRTRRRARADRPAYLARVDVHSALASSALREQAPAWTPRTATTGRAPLSADAHHRVRAAARALLSAGAARRGPHRRPRRVRGRGCGGRA